MVAEAVGGVSLPNSVGSAAAPVRVALLSDRWLSPAPWHQRGMSVVRVRSVALASLLADAPSAIVIDPACGDAAQLADCWRLHELLHVPLVVLAEGASSDEVVAWLERGADEVVTQPPVGPLLSARLAAILRRTQKRTPEQPTSLVHLSDAEVDLTRRLVRRADGTRTLSRTEFKLLQALLDAGGRACTHTELVIRVWGAECASATHYLRLYIRYLRQKIERDPLQPRHILNVRGIGYRLAFDPAPAPSDLGLLSSK